MRTFSDWIFVVKMATVLEGCITEQQRSVVRFSVGKRTQCKYIYKETFPVYGGKCLSRKAVRNCVAKVSLMTKGLNRKCGSGR
jgi:hypothetical protein